MFCFERGDQRVFGIHRENLRPGSEPEAYDICRHELSPAERKTRVHISRKGHMLSPQSLAEACDRFSIVDYTSSIFAYLSRRKRPPPLTASFISSEYNVKFSAI